MPFFSTTAFALPNKRTSVSKSVCTLETSLIFFELRNTFTHSVISSNLLSFSLRTTRLTSSSSSERTYLAAEAAVGCVSGSETSVSVSESLSPAKNRDMMTAYSALKEQHQSVPHEGKSFTSAPSPQQNNQQAQTLSESNMKMICEGLILLAIFVPDV
eukprot:scpid37397/ scgid27416/ 